jgi:hypothetical protein
MKLKIAMTLWLAVWFWFSSHELKADDSVAPVKTDSPAAPQTDSALVATAQAGPAPAAAPQMDPAMAAALAQAMKILGQSPGDSATPAATPNSAGQAASTTPEDAGKNSALADVTKAIANDPAMSAAILQAAKMLAQSLQDPTTTAAVQKQASALSETAEQDGKQLVRDNASKVEGDDSRQAAQAEIEEAQRMADAALANAAQAASTATATTTAAAVSAGNRAVAGHDSVNGLVESAQMLGPDPNDKNHHSLDSLF